VRRERRQGLQVPEVLIEAKCQYRGEGGKRASKSYPSSPPAARGLPLLLYCVVEWTAVLSNLASGGASWRALYPSMSGFEGGDVRASCSVVVCTLTRGCC
jgi:hypothetical protein